MRVAAGAVLALAAAAVRCAPPSAARAAWTAAARAAATTISTRVAAASRARSSRRRLAAAAALTLMLMPMLSRRAAKLDVALRRVLLVRLVFRARVARVCNLAAAALVISRARTQPNALGLGDSFGQLLQAPPLPRASRAVRPRRAARRCTARRGAVAGCARLAGCAGRRLALAAAAGAVVAWRVRQRIASVGSSPALRRRSYFCMK